MNACYILCVVLIALALREGAADSNDTCCMPDQYQGKQLTLATAKFGGIKWYSSEVYYDAVNERQAIITNITSEGGRVQRLMELYLHQNESLYTVNMDSGLCVVEYLPAPFRPRCVPQDASAVLETDQVLGGGAQTLAVDRVGYQAQAKDGTLLHGLVTVTDDCVPVVETLVGFFSFGEARTSTTEFWDVQDGITSADIFDPPAQCLYTGVRTFASEPASKDSWHYQSPLQGMY